MANPFDVEVVNPLQALMFGQQSYATGIENSRKQAVERAKLEASHMLASGDRQGALAKLLGLGEYQGANVINTMDQQQYQRGRDTINDSFRQAEAARAQRNADRSYKLQERQFAENQDYTPEELDARRREQARLAGINLNTPAGQVFLTSGQYDPTVGQQAKNPFADSMQKQDAERVNSYSEGAKLAEEGTATLDQIDALRKQAFTAPVIGPLASKVGYPANQALDAAANQLSLDVAQKMKGSLSDKDIAFVKSQIPTAATGGQAGESASGLIRAGFERSRQRAAFYRTWAERNGNINGADVAWNRYINENPLTVDDAKALGGRKYNPNYNKDFSSYIKNGQSGQGRGADDMLAFAREAIAQGAPKSAVMQRLRDAGIDTSEFDGR